MSCKNVYTQENKQRQDDDAHTTIVIINNSRIGSLNPGLSIPQYGQVLASVETSLLHSLQVVNAMGYPS
jgi:hypothetical protein